VKFTIPRSAFGAVGIIPALALHPWFSAPVSRLNSIPAQRFGFAAHDFLRVRSARPVFGSRGQVSQFLMKILVRTPASGLCLVHEPKCTPVDFPSWSVHRSQRPDFYFATNLFLRRSSVIAAKRPSLLFPLKRAGLSSHSSVSCVAAPVCTGCAPQSICLILCCAQLGQGNAFLLISACSWSLCGLSHA
jgi:hypothetical protein